ncbi:MAG: MFS transporter [Methanotrichaceae archaeon]
MEGLCLPTIGAAMFIAVGPAMISAILPQEIRGRSMGYLSIAAAMGIALGPGIGGYLTTYLSWRSIFFVNVPICIFAIILGQRIVPDIPGSRPGEKIDMRNVKVPSVMMRRRPLHYA